MVVVIHEKAVAIQVWVATLHLSIRIVKDLQIKTVVNKQDYKLHIFLADFNKLHSSIRALSKVTASENLPSAATSEIPFQKSTESRDISPYVAEVFTDNRSIDLLLYIVALEWYRCIAVL